MKMKRENLEHIKERFENETGAVLPVKANIEFPEWAGRIAVAAAGIVCMVGLGLVWNKVSADKSAEMMLSAEESGTEVLPDEIELTDEETEDEYVVIKEEKVADITFKDENGEEAEIQDSTEYNVDINLDELPELGEVGSAMAVINADGLFLYVYKEGEIDNVDGIGFEIDGNWTWPVPAAKERGSIVVNDIPDGATDVDMQIANEYLAVLGELGDSVVAMHAGTISATGFDTERGNYIDIEMENAVLEYRHLDEIKVSVGDVVNAGDEVGKLGSSGRSTGPHLGITVKDNQGHALSILFMEGAESKVFEEPEEAAEITE